MRPGYESVERIRCHEVSRVLKKVDLSPEEAGIIDLLSRSLVGKLLDGPISEVMARAESEMPFARRSDPEAPSGLEGHGSDRISNKTARSNGETGGTHDRSISVS